MSYALKSQIALPSSIAFRRLTASMVPILLGSFIVYGVAFAPLKALHNAAHDTRHSIVVPCH